jgi:hypothetical protein
VQLDHCIIAVSDGSGRNAVDRQGAGDRGRSVYFRDPDGSLLELISHEGDA